MGNVRRRVARVVSAGSRGLIQLIQGTAYRRRGTGPRLFAELGQL